jgi:hypothetical protein
MPKDGDGIPISTFLQPIKTNPLFQNVWKKGRTTGITHGITNGVKSVILGEREGLPSAQVLVVVGTGETKPFSKKGDSGAFVVSNHGEMVGILHSGHLADDLTCLTPYDVLVKDIEEVTETKVVWTV